MGILQGFNINAFRSSFRNDLEPHHASHFEVLIVPPVSILVAAGITSDATQLLSGNFLGAGDSLLNIRMRCQAINFPGKSLEVFMYNQIVGPPIRIANGSLYDTVNIDFILTQNGIERQLMQAWIDFVQPTQLDDMDVTYYDSYTGNIILNLYDTSGNIAQLVRLGNIFPIALGGVQLSWAAANQISTFQAGFAFESMQPISPQELPSGAVDLVPIPAFNLRDLASQAINAVETLI